MLAEAVTAAGFFALAVPFGYLSRKVRGWEPPAKKWAVFLALVHTPVVPLIVYVKLAAPPWEFEALLVGVVLGGHVAGVLASRALATRAAAAQPAAE